MLSVQNWTPFFTTLRKLSGPLPFRITDESGISNADPANSDAVKLKAAKFPSPRLVHTFECLSAC
jgi:hypothetical protein